MMSIDIELEPEVSVSSPTKLFDSNFGGQPWAPRYDVSPDGEHFVAITRAPPPPRADRLHVILNWFEELRDLMRTEQ